MLFTIQKSDFENSIVPTSLSVAARNTNPVLEGIYITAKNDTLTMCTYDLEKAIRVRTQAEVEEEGEIIVDAAKLLAIVRSLPDGEIRFESNSANAVKISSEGSDFQITGMRGSDYPQIPDVKGDIKFTLPQNKLRKLITKTIFAVSNDDMRPAYTGSLFVIENNSLTLTATNGNRLATGTEPGMTENENLQIKCDIPSKAQSNLLKLISDTDEVINVELARKHIIFTFDNIYFITRLLNHDEFFDYKKKIPTAFNIMATVNRLRFIESIERASLILDDRLKSSLKIEFSEGYMEIRCETEMGKVNDRFKVDYEGTDLSISFNHKYLLDALKMCDSEKVNFNLTGNLSASVIVPVKESEEDADYLNLVLPVRTVKQ